MRRFAGWRVAVVGLQGFWMDEASVAGGWGGGEGSKEKLALLK